MTLHIPLNAPLKSLVSKYPRLVPDQVCLLPPSIGGGNGWFNWCGNPLYHPCETDLTVVTPYNLGLSDGCTKALMNILTFQMYTSTTYFLNTIWSASEPMVGTVFMKLRALTAGGRLAGAFFSPGDNYYPYSDGICYMGTFITPRKSWTPPINVYRPHTYAVSTRPGANGWNAYQNGILVLSDTGTETRSWVDSRVATVFDTGFSVECFYVYKRCLVQSEICQLTVDPYCWLNDNRRQVFPGTAAAAPSTTFDVIGGGCGQFMIGS